MSELASNIRRMLEIVERHHELGKAFQFHKAIVLSEGGQSEEADQVSMQALVEIMIEGLHLERELRKLQKRSDEILKLRKEGQGGQGDERETQKARG